MPSPKQQLLPLTGIRFFLAMWVVAFHRGDLAEGMSKLPEILTRLSATGYMAVDVFFVLSGFVLSYNYPLENHWSSSQLTRFALARFARIYPAYCLGLLLWAPRAIYAVATNPSVPAIGRESIVAVLNFTLLQSWIPQTARSWNSPGWSLSDEAFFYFCFPFVGVTLWKFSTSRSLLVGVVLLWTLALVAPLAYISVPFMQFTDGQPGSGGFWLTLIRFNPLLRLPSFCVGILVARAYFQLRGKNSSLLGRGYWLYVPGFLLEIWAITNSRSTPYVVLHNGLLLPLHALVILGFALGGGTVARLLSIPPLVFLGNASYSMYILHSPIAGWMNHILVGQFSTELKGPVLTSLYVIMVIFLSSLVFRFIEEPASRILKRRYRETPVTG